MPLDWNLVLSTSIVIMILSITGTFLTYLILTQYKGKHTIDALGIGASIGLILVAAFIFWQLLGN